MLVASRNLTPAPPFCGINSMPADSRVRGMASKYGIADSGGAQEQGYGFAI